MKNKKCYYGIINIVIPKPKIVLVHHDKKKLIKIAKEYDYTKEDVVELTEKQYRKLLKKLMG